MRPCPPEHSCITALNSLYDLLYVRVECYVQPSIFKYFYVVLLIHGDMDQFERNKVIASFKKKEVPVLVATDVAGKIQEVEMLNSLR
jgi:superfamily II DNA or RNA helicase